MVVLDSGGVTWLAQGSPRAQAFMATLREQGDWPAHVPSPVLIECLRGDGAKDATTNRLLHTCEIMEQIPEDLARRAAYLRSQAGTGSAVDALVVAVAEPAGLVLTSDPRDMRAIAEHAIRVIVQPVGHGETGRRRQ